MIWLVVALACWAVWLIMIVGGALLAPRRIDQPCTNGIWIYMPDRLLWQLPSDEWAAVYMHEVGHRVRLHVLRNIARLAVFIPRSETSLRQQEFEADDYAAARGHAAALARALRRLSEHPDDLHRAARLEARG